MRERLGKLSEKVRERVGKLSEAKTDGSKSKSNN